MGDAVGAGGVDGVFGEVAEGAEIVGGAARGAVDGAELGFHFVSSLPGASNDFADAAHGLAVAGHHGNGAEVVEKVLGGDRFRADAGFGKGDVFGNAGVEVVAHHEHVEVLVDGIDGEGSGGVGGGGEDVGFAADADDVGSVAAAGAFGVIGVDGASFEGGEGGFEEAGFVEGIGVDGDLDVELIGDAEAGIDGGGGGAPVFVQFEADGAGADLFAEGFGGAAVSFAEEAEIHGVVVGGFEHAGEVPPPGGAGGSEGAVGRASAAAEEGGDAAGEGVLDLLRANEVDVGIDAASGDDLAFAGDDFGGGADDHGDAVLEEGIAGVADGGDAAMFDADVGFDDALDGVEDEGVGDDEVEALGVEGEGGLGHAVADDFAAAEFDFIAVAAVFGDEVALDLDEQVGVGEAHLVSRGGAEHGGVLFAGDLHGGGAEGEGRLVEGAVD